MDVFSRRKGVLTIQRPMYGRKGNDTSAETYGERKPLRNLLSLAQPVLSGNEIYCLEALPCIHLNSTGSAPASAAPHSCAMTDRRYRVLAVASDPVQYMTPIFRRLAKHPSLDFQVAYWPLQGAQQSQDPDFAAEFQWDVPVLEGYEWSSWPSYTAAPARMG